MFPLLCIAHPGAAVFDAKALEADAAAALQAGALLEAAEDSRKTEPNLGGTANESIRPEHSYSCVRDFLFLAYCE